MRLFLLFVIFTFSYTLILSQEANINIKKIEKNGDYLIIKYDLSGSDKFKYNIAIKAQTDKGKLIANPIFVYGDIGESIKAGKDKAIYWDVLQEFNSVIINEVTVFQTKKTRKTASKVGRGTGRVLDILAIGTVALAKGIAFTAKGIGIGLWKTLGSVYFKPDAIGIRGDIGFSYPVTDYGNDQSYIASWSGGIGISGRHNLSKRIGFQWEVFYANTGHTRERTVSIIENGRELNKIQRQNLNFFQLQHPLFFTFQITDYSSWSSRGIELQLGGYGAYSFKALGYMNPLTNLDESIKLDYFNPTDFPERLSHKQPFSRWDYGILVGLNLKGDNLDLGLRYNHGLHNVNFEGYWNEDEIFDSKEIKLGSLTLYASIYINIQRKKKNYKKR